MNSTRFVALLAFRTHGPFYLLRRPITRSKTEMRSSRITSACNLGRRPAGTKGELDPEPGAPSSGLRRPVLRPTHPYIWQPTEADADCAAYEPTHARSRFPFASLRSRHQPPALEESFECPPRGITPSSSLL